MGDLVRKRLQVMSIVAQLMAESAPCPQPLVVPLLADFDLILALHLTLSLVNGTFGVQAERTNRNASQIDW